MSETIQNVLTIENPTAGESTSVGFDMFWYEVMA